MHHLSPKSESSEVFWDQLVHGYGIEPKCPALAVRRAMERIGDRYRGELARKYQCLAIATGFWAHVEGRHLERVMVRDVNWPGISKRVVRASRS